MFILKLLAMPMYSCFKWFGKPKILKMSTDTSQRNIMFRDSPDTGEQVQKSNMAPRFAWMGIFYTVFRILSQKFARQLSFDFPKILFHMMKRIRQTIKIRNRLIEIHTAEFEFVDEKRI